MTAEEIFKEVLKSPEFREIFEIPKDCVEQESYSTKSNYPVIEIVKAVISGQENHRDKNAIFQSIQKQIMQL